MQGILLVKRLLTSVEVYIHKTVIWGKLLLLLLKYNYSIVEYNYSIVEYNYFLLFKLYS